MGRSTRSRLADDGWQPYRFIPNLPYVMTTRYIHSYMLQECSTDKKKLVIDSLKEIDAYRRLCGFRLWGFAWS